MAYLLTVFCFCFVFFRLLRLLVSVWLFFLFLPGFSFPKFVSLLLFETPPSASVIAARDLHPTQVRRCLTGRLPTLTNSLYLHRLVVSKETVREVIPNDNKKTKQKTI